MPPKPKRCVGCKEEFEGRQHHLIGGGKCICESCFAAAAMSYNGANAGWIRREYNLSIEQHGAMYAAQAGRCAICAQERRLCVDHDHETGRVRGLLCSNCNTALGMLEDDPSRLWAALGYLGQGKPEQLIPPTHNTDAARLRIAKRRARDLGRLG